MDLQNSYESDNSEELFNSDEELFEKKKSKRSRPKDESFTTENSTKKRKVSKTRSKLNLNYKNNYKANKNILNNSDFDIPKENICNNKTSNLDALNNMHVYENNNSCSNNVVLDESISSINSSINLSNNLPTDNLDQLEVGDMIWSKLKGYPYWPAMISMDPIKHTYRANKIFLKKSKIIYHVQYFGTTPEHGWTTPCGILEYKGVDQFNKYVQDQVAAAPTASLKKQAQLKFKVASNRFEMWQKAVDCSERGYKLTPEQRLKGLMGDVHKLFGIKETLILLPEDTSSPKRPKSASPIIVKLPSPIRPVKQNDSFSKEDFKEFNSEGVDEELAAILNPMLPVKSEPTDKYVKIAPKPPSMDAVTFENNSTNAVLSDNEIEPVSELTDFKPFLNSASAKLKKRRDSDVDSVKSGSDSRDSKLSLDNIITKLKNKRLSVDHESIKSDSGDSKSSLNNMLTAIKPKAKKRANIDKICMKCEKQKTNELETCQGKCHRLFHKNCMELGDNGLVCENCKTNSFECIICLKKDDFENISICNQEDCTMFFHSLCMSLYIAQYDMPYPEGQCPQHFCISCVFSKANLPPYFRKNKFTRCMRCPHAYHKNICLPAGSIKKTANYIVCPDHLEKKEITNGNHNANWCFMCLNRGGDLKCCSTCPAAFHTECYPGLLYDIEGFRCQNCKYGVQPKYGDKVWLRIAGDVWWPCKTVKTSSVPKEIRDLPHQQGEFVVSVYSSNDYLWTDSRFVFHFEECLDNKRNFVMPYKKYQKLYRQAIMAAMKDQDSDNEDSEENADDEEDEFVPSKPKYKSIKFSRPYGDFQLNPIVLKDINVCDCTLNGGVHCSDDLECWNRNLKYECNPNLCKLKDKCKNQRFQSCEYPELEVFQTSKRGWGLKTLEDIKAHQFVIEYVGELITEEECFRRMDEAHEQNERNFYFLTIDKDNIIDAGPKGNLSRFLNHSCNPNLETQKWEVNCNTRIGLFAKEYIPAGAELTFNYMLKSMGATRAKCQCKSFNCTGFIGSAPKVSTPSVASKVSTPTTNIRETKNGESTPPSIRQKRTPMIPRRFSDCITSLPHLPSPTETVETKN